MTYTTSYIFVFFSICVFCSSASSRCPPRPLALHLATFFSHNNNHTADLLFYQQHTYLHHIATHYNNLPQVTLFLQGDIHSTNEGTPAHTDLTLSELASRATTLSPGAVLPIGLLHTFSAWEAIQYKPDWVRRRGATLVRSKYTPGEFWQEVLFPEAQAIASSASSSQSSPRSGATNSSSPSSEEPTSPPTKATTTPLPKEVRFVQGACFAVTREAIHRRPHEWWARMLRWFEDLDECNPEEGHYMERFWWSVFDEGTAVRW